MDIRVCQSHQEPIIYRTESGSYQLAKKIMALQVYGLYNLCSRLALVSIFWPPLHVRVGCSMAT